MWAGWYQPRGHQWLLRQTWVLLVPQHNTVSLLLCAQQSLGSRAGSSVRQECMGRWCHSKRSQRGAVAMTPTYSKQGRWCVCYRNTMYQKEIEPGLCKTPSHSNIYSSCVCTYAKIFSLLRHETNIVILPVNPISKFYLTRWMYITWFHKLNK